MLKSILKNIYSFTKKIFEITLSAIKIILNNSLNSISIDSIKNVKNSDSCLIMGNGPSLKEYISNTKNFIGNGEIIVVNDFVLAKEYNQIKPQYYVFADPGYWDKNVPDEMVNLRNNIFEKLNSETNWNMVICISKQGFNSGIFQKRINNNNISFIYFNTTQISGSDSFKNFCYNKNWGMPVLQNVINAALYIAIFNNYTNIKLVGVEHSWTKDLFVNNNNEVCQLNTHFYDEDLKHTVWLKSNGVKYRMHEILSDLSKMFYSYVELESFANYKKVMILNLTPNSFIDSFKKIDYNEN